MTPGVQISAFNLQRGAVLATDPAAEQLYVVTQVLYRHTSSERIGVIVREVLDPEVRNQADTKVSPVPRYDAPSFDFEDQVWLVGLIVNPDSWDDDDFGQ